MSTQLLFFLLGVGAMAVVEHYVPKIISLFKKGENEVKDFVEKVKGEIETEIEKVKVDLKNELDKAKVEIASLKEKI